MRFEEICIFTVAFHILEDVIEDQNVCRLGSYIHNELIEKLIVKISEGYQGADRSTLDF